MAASLAGLGQPFTIAAVKFKPQTVSKDKKKALASFYIDSRLVVERLNEVVGPDNWWDEYRLLVDGAHAPALFYPIECRLTVNGVTRADVGQGANQVVDDKAWKSAYSDAFKRAAVKFRVGAYLYVLPKIWAATEVGQDGKVYGFSKEGQAHLRSEYVRWLKSDLNRFGVALDHGDIDESDDSPAAATPEFEVPAKAKEKLKERVGSAPFVDPDPVPASEEQVRKVRALIGELMDAGTVTEEGMATELALFGVTYVRELTHDEADALFLKLERLKTNAEAAA